MATARTTPRHPSAQLATLIAAGLCAALPAQAQGAPDLPFGPETAAPAATALAPVGVTATRNPQSIDTVPATVSIIGEQQLQRQNAIRPQDAIRYEPGVNFGNQPARGGGTNFVIRGIGDNRVRVQVDGVRLPDFPGSNIGAGNFSRDFVDLESVRRLEILRGPASALYGSDAIGGVVSYVLKDPSDYLAGSDSNTYTSARIGYSGADSSWTETITAAVRAENVEALLLYTRRDGHQLLANGGLPTNPQTYSTNNVLGRLIFRGDNADAVRVTGEFFDRNLTTQVNSERSITYGMGGAPGTAILDTRGQDQSQRGRFTIDYIRESPLVFADRLEARAYYTRLDRQELTNQLRSSFTGLNPVPNRLRASDFGFEQDILGGEVQLDSRVTWGGFEHRLTYGATLEQTNTSRPRDRTEANLITGAITRSVAGEIYPNKNFPDTTTTTGGLYLQDQILMGRATVTPGIRFDWFRLRPNEDADFLRSAQTAQAAAIAGSDDYALSPKLGAVYRLDETYSVYGQYAAGFRAPAYDNTNFGFTNRTFGYTILPSGNLKPETSNGVEAGLRGRSANGSNFQVNGFYNAYDNFIETVVLGTVGGLVQYQYQNVSSVTIYGAEARGEWRIDPRWSLRGNFAYAYGINNDTRQPVGTVDPARLVVGLAWQHPSGLGVEANVTHGWRYTRTATPTAFQAPEYTVLDLAAHYDWNSNFSVNAGVFNVTNERYWNSQDINGVAANSPTLGLYAQPGRYAAINAVVRW